MNINDYSINFFSPEGYKIYTFNAIYELEFGRKKNDIGALSILIPNLELYNINDFKRNCTAEIYRDGIIIPVLWYLKKVTITEDSIELVFFDHLTLLTQRYVTWYEVEFFNYPSHMRLPSDELIHEVIRTNYIDVLDNLGFSVDAPEPISDMNTDARVIDFKLVEPLGVGTVIEDSFAWRKVSEVVKNITETAETNGENIWYDFIYTPNGDGFTIGNLSFRIWYNIRGNDRRINKSNNPVVFSPELGNLSNYSLELDYENYYNQVYVVAKELPELDDGVNLVRIVPYPQEYEYEGQELIEHVEILNDEEINEEIMEAKAKTLLAQGKPISRLTGDIIQTDDYQFFRDYNFGDKVSAYWQNLFFETEITTYNVTVSDTEEIRIPFENIIGIN
jgi:hypothetical protein